VRVGRRAPRWCSCASPAATCGARREADRSTARCDFCDTDFVGGEKLDGEALVARIVALPGPRWSASPAGEPTLAAGSARLERLARRRLIAPRWRPNGTVDITPIRELLDWVCVSPKTPAPELNVTRGDELKAHLSRTERR